MLTFDSGLQSKFRINDFCGLQGYPCHLDTPREYTVVAEYSAEANS